MDLGKRKGNFTDHACGDHDGNCCTRLQLICLWFNKLLYITDLLSQPTKA